MNELLSKLDLNKFIELIKNDKFEYFGGHKGFPEISIGLTDSYFNYKKKKQDEVEFRMNYFKDSDVDELFQDTTKIREDFLRLDKSVNYNTIIQTLSDPEGDNMVFGELGYLSFAKSKYSFLISAYDYNMNFTLKVFKVFNNLDKKDFKKININNDWDIYTEGCYYYMFNNKWDWNLNKIKKEFVKKKYTRIHLCLCDEKKINKRNWNPRRLKEKEDYIYIK